MPSRPIASGLHLCSWVSTGTFYLISSVDSALEMGQHKATRFVFNYEHPPHPPRPSLYYHMEKQLFDRVYWHIVLKGLV
jgi:hypothetical protein